MNKHESESYELGYKSYRTGEARPIRYFKRAWEHGWNDACSDNNEAVLWLNGKIIDHGMLRFVEIFFNHLKEAHAHPIDFLFEGAGGKFNAQEWLAYHAERLRMPMDGTLVLRTKHTSRIYHMEPQDVCYYV